MHIIPLSTCSRDGPGGAPLLVFFAEKVCSRKDCTITVLIYWLSHESWSIRCCCGFGISPGGAENAVSNRTHATALGSHWRYKWLRQNDDEFAKWWWMNWLAKPSYCPRSETWFMMRRLLNKRLDSSTDNHQSAAFPSIFCDTTFSLGGFPRRNLLLVYLQIPLTHKWAQKKSFVVGASPLILELCLWWGLHRQWRLDKSLKVGLYVLRIVLMIFRQKARV